MTVSSSTNFPSRLMFGEKRQPPTENTESGRKYTGKHRGPAQVPEQAPDSETPGGKLPGKRGKHRKRAGDVETPNGRQHTLPQGTVIERLNAKIILTFPEAFGLAGDNNVFPPGMLAFIDRRLLVPFLAATGVAKGITLHAKIKERREGVPKAPPKTPEDAETPGTEAAPEAGKISDTDEVPDAKDLPESLDNPQAEETPEER